jgi:hypothetical protein
MHLRHGLGGVTHTFYHTSHSHNFKEYTETSGEPQPSSLICYEASDAIGVSNPQYRSTTESYDHYSLVIPLQGPPTDNHLYNLKYLLGFADLLTRDPVAYRSFLTVEWILSGLRLDQSLMLTLFY